jgi:hypothetical protein
MNLNKAVVTVGLTALGVIVAGYVMYQMRNVAVIGDATKGFDS